ncbi:CHAT domain-containing protein [Agromyces sp. NPDC058484]|uniref:CHAT domain-containing protein n=1 Tax=Agromyces sp. NPDC058484 TaxID=3346524 RepID=UPI0036529E56
MDTVMELEIGPGPEPGSYVVHVLRSVGGGEPRETISLDLDDLIERRPLLEASVLSSSVSARRVMSDTETALQQVGLRLFESTFRGAVATAYRTSMAVASERGKDVQISLRLTAPGLAALPWEALFDAEAGVYLCRKETLVRHVPAPYSPAALAIEPPMRVLGMISSPRGLPMLDVSAEQERLEEALRPHLDSGRVELHWLDDVSWDGVHGKLLEGAWHVLHFVGHGVYDTETDEGVLAFVGHDGRADYVPASALADLLDEADPTPRLVVLNSCESGAAGTSDLFSGTAAALAHSGIRAVAAMQFSISDLAAIAFARGFYTALANGRGIDEAVRSGRIGILGIGRGTLEWVTPVLYLRGHDTKLFDVAPMPAAKPATTGPIAGAIPIIHTGPIPDAAARPVPDAPAPPRIAATEEVTDAAPKPPAPTAPPVHAATPPAPPHRPAPAASVPPPRPRKSGGKPWLVVGIIATLAIGAGAAAVLVLNPGIFDPTRDVAVSSDVPTEAPASPLPSVGETTPPEVVTSVPTAQLPVPMNVAWTPTGVWCEAGDTFDITVTGEAWHDIAEDSLVGPDGLTGGEVPQARVFAEANTASVIGGFDTNGNMFAVGNGSTYTCQLAGQLFLGINDTYLVGNHGEFWAEITHTPAG